MIRPSDYKCPMTREKCSKNCPWIVETEVEDHEEKGPDQEYECAIRIIAWSASSARAGEEA